MAVILYREVNAKGYLIGETHPKAKLSDAEVNRMRDMHEKLGVSERRIAVVFSVSRRTVRDILQYRTRTQVRAGVIAYVDPRT